MKQTTKTLSLILLITLFTFSVDTLKGQAFHNYSKGNLIIGSSFTQLNSRLYSGSGVSTQIGLLEHSQYKFLDFKTSLSFGNYTRINSGEFGSNKFQNFALEGLVSANVVNFNNFSLFISLGPISSLSSGVINSSHVKDFNFGFSTEVGLKYDNPDHPVFFELIPINIYGGTPNYKGIEASLLIGIKFIKGRHH